MLQSPGIIEVTWSEPERLNGVIRYYLLHYRLKNEFRLWSNVSVNGWRMFILHRIVNNIYFAPNSWVVFC